MKTAVPFLAIVATIVVLSSATKVKKCDKGPKALPTVDFGGCEGGDPKDRCVFNRGESYDFTVNFKAAAASENLKDIPVAKVFGEEYLFKPAQDDDACSSISSKDNKDTGAQCPLKKGTQYVYKKSIQIPDDETQFKLTPEFRFMDANNKTITCFKFSLQIK